MAPSRTSVIFSYYYFYYHYNWLFFFISSFNYFNNYVLNNYYVPGTALSAGDVKGNKIKEYRCVHKAYILVERR